jgi:hypothetical protein
MNRWLTNSQTRLVSLQRARFELTLLVGENRFGNGSFGLTVPYSTSFAQTILNRSSEDHPKSDEVLVDGAPASDSACPMRFREIGRLITHLRKRLSITDEGKSNVCGNTFAPVEEWEGDAASPSQNLQC